MINTLTALSGTAPAAEVIFRLIRKEINAVEAEFERHAASNIQVIKHIGRYLHKTGGKRVRPALVILSSKIFSEKTDYSVIQMAAVMEFLHTATLVHDDVIDGAEMRRNRKTVSSEWGNEIAVLMGDWLYMTAYDNALQQRNFDVLDALTEATRKMTEGELLQLTQIGNIRITEEEYLNIASRKTGYLFSASCRVGACVSGAVRTHHQALADYGLYLGIAFQLVDDLLDFTSNSDKLGKPVLSDLREGKVTLPIIRLLKKYPKYSTVVRTAMEEPCGENKKALEVLALLEEYGELDNARDEAYFYARKAQEALGIFHDNEDNKHLRALNDIAQYIVERDK